MVYRNLTHPEIEILQSQGCSAENWEDIRVKDPFTPHLVRNVFFGGRVHMGILPCDSIMPTRQIGLYDCEIYNCVIGDHVRIAQVSLLRSYEIEDHVTIQNVGTLEVEGVSTFGNGTEINALNEGGGRTLKIYDRLTAQIAYLQAVYRHNPRLIAHVTALIDDYTDTHTSNVGKIGSHATLINCQTLKNLVVGPYAHIEGALRLENGTIASEKAAPTRIGNGVYAKDFIVLEGSSVDSSAILEHTFVGQAVKLGKQFSAEHSVFFANCEGFHSEACSIFAGPYTVTHHKSTLLIAGLFSFYNAGSGTNQSNHMYKLGPNHQGILQRGSKTGSFSYLLWPCAVGPYSVVIGKHYTNFDTTNFPFSYINEEKGKSVLTPAMNLFTVGTRRDSQKWPSRDRRKSHEKLDLIHFDLWSPFVVGKIWDATQILQHFIETTPKEKDSVQHKGITIKRLLLKTCRKYYEIALKIFLGECLRDRLAQYPDAKSLAEIRANFSAKMDSPSFEWIDVCGLLAPASVIEDLILDIEENRFQSIDEVAGQLNQIFHQYEIYKWAWFCQFAENWCGHPIHEFSIEQLCAIIQDWKENRIKLAHMILQDAAKEFDQNAMIGYGIDGDLSIQEEDFQHVRGNKDSNSFIEDLRAEISAIESQAEQLIQRIQQFSGE